jgi:hypothetical protein
MDPHVHTAIALVCMFATYWWGRKQSTRNALEIYTEFLLENKFLKIETTEDGEEELIPHKD